MVKKAEKERMSEFIANMLENSGLYIIKRCDYKGISFEEKKYFAAQYEREPRKIFVFSLSYKLPITKFKRLLRKAKEMNIYTLSVFYKDENEFHVRLGASAKYRDNKSLKNYAHEDLNKMINLRGLEKEVILLYDCLNDYRNELTYYQPSTERLDESLRTYKMKNVELDYSHLEQYDRGYSFAEEETSLSYKRAGETPGRKITTAAKILCQDQLKRAIIVPFGKDN